MKKAFVLFFFAFLCSQGWGQPNMHFEKYQLDLGTLDLNSSSPIVVTKTFKFTNTGDQPLLIQKIYHQRENIVKVQYPTSSIAPNASGNITVTLTLKTEGFGEYLLLGKRRYVISIRSNAGAHRIYMDFNVVDTYPEPDIEFVNDTILLGTVDVEKQTAVEGYFSFRNKGDIPVTITDMTVPDGMSIHVDYPKTPIAANTTRKIPFTWNRLDTLDGDYKKEFSFTFINKKANYPHYHDKVKKVWVKINAKNDAGYIKVEKTENSVLYRGYMEDYKSATSRSLLKLFLFTRDDPSSNQYHVPVVAVSFSSRTDKANRISKKTAVYEDGLNEQTVDIELSNGKSLSFPGATIENIMRDEFVKADNLGYGSFWAYFNLLSDAELSETAEVLRLLRTYDIRKMKILGETFVIQEAHTAKSFDKMVKMLKEKVTNSSVLNYDPNKVSSDHTTSTTSSSSTAAATTTPKTTNVLQQERGASIENVEVLHNQTVNLEKGMTIKMKLHVNGAKGRPCSVIAYFYKSNGDMLKDFNNRYTTVDGQVGSSTNIRPSYDRSTWEEISISIPYSELHFSDTGEIPIKFKMIVWDNSEEKREGEVSRLYDSDFYSTTINIKPTVLIRSAYAMQNVVVNYVKGMMIHLYMEMNSLKGKNVKLLFKFYGADNKTKLVNMYGQQVEFSTFLRPAYDSTVWSDYQYFIPYANFTMFNHYGGKYTFDVEVLDENNNLLIRAENVPVTLYF